MSSKLDLTADTVDEAPKVAGTPADRAPDDLKGKTARGALVSAFGQGANFVLRIGSMVVLARLLLPADFGLVGMVTACTGFLSLFRDAGLSMATVHVPRLHTNRPRCFSGLTLPSVSFWLFFAWRWRRS